MKTTIQIEVDIDELIKEVEECAICGDDISRMSKFKLLYLLKHYNDAKEEIKQTLDAKKQTLPCVPCDSCVHKEKCDECQKNNYCYFKREVKPSDEQ